MHPPGRRPHIRCHIFQKRDDIMVGAPLDLLNLSHFKARLGPNLTGILKRNQPRSGHRLAGGDLNFEPNFVLTLFGPNGAHFRKGVAVNHAGRLKCFPARGKSKMRPFKSAPGSDCLTFSKPFARLLRSEGRNL